MGTPYLFDNAVLDRNARLANGLLVEPAVEFAEALLMLGRFPDGGVDGDDELLDSFMDRKRFLADQRGGIHVAVAFIVVLVAGGLWGWTHSSAAPNGATLLAVLVLAIAIAVPTAVIGWARRIDHNAAAYTKRMESGMQQDTSGDHIWDA